MEGRAKENYLKVAVAEKCTQTRTTENKSEQIQKLTEKCNTLQRCNKRLEKELKESEKRYVALKEFYANTQNETDLDLMNQK